MRLQVEAQLRAIQVPYPIVVGCLHAEGIPPRRNVCVVRRPPRTRVNPSAIESLQHVAITNLLRGYEAETRVVEFESRMARLDHKWRSLWQERLLPVVHLSPL